MAADELLSRLGIRTEGRRRDDMRTWTTKCPSHDDKVPSLSVAVKNDGRVLVHCFGGCSVESVVAALSLTIDDLFPEKSPEFAKGERRPFIPPDVFEIARREIAIVAIAAADMHANRGISEADYERIFVAVERLDDIASAAYGRR